jgi:hypothetical protein
MIFTCLPAGLDALPRSGSSCGSRQGYVGFPAMPWRA